MCAEGGKTKFVEMGGKYVSDGLSKSVNFRGQKGCVFIPKCNVDSDKDCRVSRLVYEVECNRCTSDPTAKKALYTGTSGHVLHKRQLEHVGEISRHQASNALFKLHEQMHQGQDTDFTSRSTRGNIQYNLGRFILEAHKIEMNHRNQDVQIMNNRSEWGNRGLPRLVINN